MLFKDNFRQASELVQTAITKTVDPDLFDIEELQLAHDSMPHDRAPWNDEYNLEFIKEVFLYHPQWMLFLYNQCVSDSTELEACGLCLLNVRLKEKERVGVLRPIYLLPAIEKVLYKMGATRLMNYLVFNDVLESRHYDFRRSCSTVDALHEMMRYM